MINSYKDPETKNEIKQKITTLQTLKELVDYMNEIYPGWILNYVNNYSYDYSHLESNWDYTCKQNKIKRGQIVIVDNIFEGDEYSILKIFINIFILSGFIVRTKDELFICEKCNSAIPNKETFEKIKNSNIELRIKEWKNKCSTCL
jgi:hypothetical protein